MTSDAPRRAATAPLSVPPPPAPPLPPQQRARNALNRFLGFPARPSDNDEDGNQGTQYWAEANRATFGRLPSLSGHDASASYKTGLELNSLSINDDGTHALLAGRDILKSIRVEEGSCTEDINLRVSNKSLDSNVNPAAATKDAGNINDVAWGKGNYGNIVAAATYNGPISIYDLVHPGIEVARLNEHRRQVHRVTFNPHAGQHLLSGSQDGTARLWDMRDLRRDSSSFSSRFTTTGQHEGVRDVKWSPTDVFALALCTDGGFVQRWDTRKLKTPLTKIAAHTRIAAHTSPCATIDWHPDGKHVLSASADKTVKVWNLSAESGRRNKPAYEIKTPYPVRNARWRPSCESSLPGDQGARLCSQIVTSYERDHDLLHIWDFRRPCLPFREIKGRRSAPTDLLWHSQDLLWTVGKEGLFLQHDVKFANKVLDHRNMQAVAVSPLGHFNTATQKRPMPIRGDLANDDSDQYFSSHHHHHHHLHLHQHQQNQQDHEDGKLGSLVTSRGSADDSIDDSFLSTSFGKKNGTRSGSHRSLKSHAEPPPVGPIDNPQPPNPRTIPLDSIITKKHVFKPGQGTASGFLPGVSDPVVLTYFAQKYKTRPLSEPPTADSYLGVQNQFEANADAAQQAGLYRMAQSWRIAGQVAKVELHRRAVAHREMRVKGGDMRKGAFDESPFARRARKYLASGRIMSSKPSTPLSKPVRAVESLQTVRGESTSNVPTPTQKPVADRPGSRNGSKPAPLKDISQDDEGLTLPPSLLSRATMDYLARKDPQQLPASSAVTGRSWYHSAEARDERRAEISSWRAPQKEPLTFELPDNAEAPHRLERHNSNDSFAMFPSVSSRDASFPVSSVASMASLTNTTQQNLMHESPHGSMNIGSSSSSERNMSDRAHPQSFYSFPSAAVPQSSQASATTDPLSPEGPAESAAILLPPAPAAQSSDATPARDIARDVKALAVNNQLSFSSDSDALSSSSANQAPRIDSFPDAIKEEVSVEDMEASGTIVPSNQQNHSRMLQIRERSKSMAKPQIVAHEADGITAAHPQRTSVHLDSVSFIAADFVGTDYPVDTEQDTPFTLIALLNQLLAYHTTDMPNPQAAAHFILLLTPLLPQTHCLSQREIDQTITVYSEHFAALGYTDEEIYSLLQNSFESLIEAGLQPLYAESIILTYHEQLQHLGLFNNAAYLRRLAYPTYPSVYEQGLKNNEIGFLCGGCKKPIKNPLNKFRCETCELRQDTCPICCCATSPFETPQKTTTAASSKNRKPRREKSREDAAIAAPIVSPIIDDIWARGTSLAPTSTAAGTNRTIVEGHSDDADTAYPPTDLHKPLLYSTCLLCNHSAHTACLRAWHSPSTVPLQSEGLCPTPSCLCACTPGLARTVAVEAINVRDAERRSSKTNRPGGASTPRIREDEWAVQTSPAVREAGGLVSLPPSRQRREREPTPQMLKPGRSDTMPAPARAVSGEISGRATARNSRKKGKGR